MLPSFEKRLRRALPAAGLLLALLLTGCGADTPQDTISRALGVDVHAGTAADSCDTHSGFHGDGLDFAVLTFPDDGLAGQLAADPAWQPLPLDDTLTALVYGLDTGTVCTGPYLTDTAGAPLLPPVTNGYVYALDRHKESTDGRVGPETLARAALNLTVALYDTDTDTLYYAALDT